MTSLTAFILEGVVALSIISLYLSFKYGYKKAVLEQYRLKLFNLRSKLYQLLYEGKIDADDPAYRHVEDHLNSFLRFAHRTTTSHLIFTMLIVKAGWYTPSKDKAYRDGISSLPQTEGLSDDIIKKLVRLKRESVYEVISFIPKYSPMWILVRAMMFIKYFFQKTKQSTGNFDTIAVSKDYDLEEYNLKKGTTFNDIRSDELKIA